MSEMNFEERINKIEEKLESIYQWYRDDYQYKFNYEEFENQFRGSFDLIYNRAKKYLKYFSKSKNVLDLGCGRGEFLTLLKDNGINAKGIDYNEKFVETCKDNGLNVTKGDLYKYLIEIDNDSIDGIMISQVIEHLPFNLLVDLIYQSYHKLLCFVNRLSRKKSSVFPGFYQKASWEKS